MATFYEGIDLRTCTFPVKPTGEVKWAYTSLWRTAERPKHNGVDIGSSHYPYYESCYGWPEYPIMPGYAVFGYDPTSGYKVNLETDFGTFVYCHNIKDNSQFNRVVSVTDLIARIGATGSAKGAHSHFIWFKPDGYDRDPVPLLDAIASAQWGSDHIPQPPLPPLSLKELDMAGVIFSVDGGPQGYLDGDKFKVIRDDGERSLRLLTLNNEKHPLNPNDEWIELSSDVEQHAAACEAYYKYYAPK